MLSYIHFLLKTFSKRISSYILVAIHLVVIFIFLVTNIDNFTGNAKGISYLSSINTFMKFFPFLFASVFSILVVTHVFKESANGVEIMIVAKPITRKQIIISKFLVVFSLLLLHQFFIFISYSLLSLYDSGASSIIRANWAISLALGGFIVQSIFVFIIILMASLVGKMGTSIIAILIAAIIPIVSFILAPLSQGQVSVSDFTKNLQSHVRSLQIGTKVVNKNGGLSFKNTYDYDLGNQMEKYQLWNDYQKNKWYQDAYPFDVWYHWGRFMNLFTKDTIVDNQPFIQNIKIQDSIKINRDDVFLEIGKENDTSFPLLKYGLLLSLHTYMYETFSEEQFQGLLKKYFDFRKMKPDPKSSFTISSIEDLVAYVKGLFKLNDNSNDVINIETFNEEKSLLRRFDIIDMHIRELKNLERSKNYFLNVVLDNLDQSLIVIVYKILSKDKKLLTTSGGNYISIDNSKVKISAETLPTKEDKDSLKKYGLVQIHNNDKKNILGYTVSSSPYASTEVVVIVWLLIGALLGGISIAIFFKKDFK